MDGTKPQHNDGGAEPVPELTPMQWKVLLVICRADCLLEKEMHDVLGISLSTFKTHKDDLCAKFKVKGCRRLIEKAMRLGMVPCYCQSASAPRE